MLKHLAANSSLLTAPGSLKTSEIPRTIRDAMSLVASMGERFLWVDALCIIQDDIGMQQSQIMKMDRIYENALLTIVAASGQDSEAGLPGVPGNEREHIQDVLHLPDGDLLTLICDSSESGNIIRKSTWAQRAWTMQELLFSGRCLIFTEHQVYWRCREAVWLEEVALEDTARTNLEILPWTAAVRLPRSVSGSDDYFQLYDDLLKNCIQRRLTYPSDLINAFSGICTRLSTVQADHFFWGMPQSQFSRSLGWYFRVDHARNHASTKVALSNGVIREVSFPSWSWAAWSSTSHTPWIDFHRHYIYGPGFEGSRMDEFQRVIDFWTSDTSGEIIPINEPGSHGADKAERRLPWQGPECKLPKDLSSLTSTSTQRPAGPLYFWSSVASLEASLFDGPMTIFGSRELKELRQRRSAEGHDVIKLDAVIVCMTATKRLVVMAVEWRDSVAYRLGCTMISEKDWMALEKREWKFITLG
ncbi:Heterokaryon incompatibility [Macrophomina phaseolina MS6]|uniref:Heterokaryon incompatibility n=1 Tax=Macrophomina phaseolina (strain MS6) TaxID=1126212 RepID=K2SDQ7_MACPH|nr:Heterokaryon incompatibility [Macrophomina phaseolina MS6]